MRSIRVFLLTFLLAAPALSQGAMRPHYHFGADASTLRTSRYYDNDGTRQKTPETLLGLTTARVWGTADLAQIGDMSVGLGAALDLADQMTRVNGADVNSGFQPRNAGLHGYIETPAYTLRGGYLFDIGEQGSSGTTTLANSDGVDAAFLGTEIRMQATPVVRLVVGADYHLTFGQDVTTYAPTLPFLPPTTQKANVDPGDQFDAFGGIGFRFGGVEVGTKLHYQLVTEGKVDDTVAQNSDGHTLALIPFLTFSQPGTPFRFWLEGASQREYGPLGITLSGKNQVASMGGVTAGLTYGF